MTTDQLIIIIIINDQPAAVVERGGRAERKGCIDGWLYTTIQQVAKLSFFINSNRSSKRTHEIL